jgi:deoxycytidine triphosphate deaminase
MVERALVDSDLLSIISGGAFRPAVCGGTSVKDLASYVQPATVDIPLGADCFLVKEKVLPFNRTVRSVLDSLTIDRLSLAGPNGQVLLKGQTYLVPCGTVKLDAAMRGSLSPKSSIGRVDLMVRGIFDRCGLYDTIPEDREGELWMEISPRSFNVRVHSGLALSQLMLFQSIPATWPDAPSSPTGSSSSSSQGVKYQNGTTAIGTPQRRQLPLQLQTPPRGRRVKSDDDQSDEPKIPTLAFSRDGKPIKPHLHRGSMVFSLSVPCTCRCCMAKEATSDTTADSPLFRRDLVGYEALPTNEVIDMSKVKAHDPTKFFRGLTDANATSAVGCECLNSDRANEPVTEPAEGTSLPACVCSHTEESRPSLTLEKDKFYILATKERISVPLNLSAEMVPFSQHVGELRAHYGMYELLAGFGVWLVGGVECMASRLLLGFGCYGGRDIFSCTDCATHERGQANKHFTLLSDYVKKEIAKLSSYFLDQSIPRQK